MNDEFLKWWNNQHGDPTEIGLMQIALRAFEHGVALEREACAKACDFIRANRPMTGAGGLIAEECAIVIRERSNV